MSILNDFSNWLADRSFDRKVVEGLGIALCLATATPALADSMVPETLLESGKAAIVSKMEREASYLATGERALLGEITKNPAFQKIIDDRHMTAVQKSHEIGNRIGAIQRVITLHDFGTGPMAIDVLASEDTRAALTASGTYGDRIQTVEQALNAVDKANAVIDNAFDDARHPIATTKDLYAVLEKVNRALDDGLPILKKHVDNENTLSFN